MYNVKIEYERNGCRDIRMFKNYLLFLDWFERQQKIETIDIITIKFIWNPELDSIKWNYEDRGDHNWTLGLDFTKEL